MKPNDKVTSTRPGFEGWQGTVLTVKNRRHGFPRVTIQWEVDGSIDEFADQELCVIFRPEDSE